MMTAEFAGAEFALLELARDGRVYADLHGTAPLRVQAGASLGQVVSVAGAAALGASAASRQTAVNATRGRERQAFVAVADGYFAEHVCALSRWQHAGQAKVTAVSAARAQAAMSFGAVAWVLEDGLGHARFCFCGGGVSAAIARMVGAARMTWQSHAVAGGMSGTSAVTQVQLRARAHVAALRQSAGWGRMAWRGRARASWMAYSGSQAVASFDGMAKLMAVWPIAATAKAAFAAAGHTGWRRFMPASGRAAWQMSAAADGGAWAHVAARARMDLRGAARISVAASVAGRARLAFVAKAEPGGEIFSRLPPAEQRWMVPPRRGPFIVPPGPLMGKA